MTTSKALHDGKGNDAHKVVAEFKSSNLKTTKTKMPTLAVLSNVSNRIRGIQGGKTVLDDITVLGTFQGNVFKQQKQALTRAGNENYGGAVNCIQNKRTKVANTVNQCSGSTTFSIEQSENLTVYEDNSFNGSVVTDKSNLRNKENLNERGNELEGAIGDTSKNIAKHESGSDTIISVIDILLSPTSVDKSSISKMYLISDNSIDAVLEDSVAEDRFKLMKKPSNDRERFFEVEEYQNDILSYFREVEQRNRPKSGYMKHQPDINYRMRTTLVDWLVDVSEQYEFNTETLFLAISYIDRFLSYMSIDRAKLQLLGTASIFIAAKYEEIYPPDVREFVFITVDTYTKKQILRTEQILLKILYFDLSGPTSYVYINTYAVLYSMTGKVRLFATYLSELALLEGDPYLKYLPSQISSAAVALSKFTLDLPMWDTELKKITNYALTDLKETIVHLCRSHNLCKTLQHQATQEKYKQTKYLEVAKIEPVNINESNVEAILLEQLELIKHK